MALATLIPLLVSILGEAPAVVESVKSIWNLATATTPATPDQQAQIDSAFEAAYQALEAS